MLLKRWTAGCSHKELSTVVTTFVAQSWHVMTIIDL
jgi:hypothetical protein